MFTKTKIAHGIASLLLFATTPTHAGFVFTPINVPGATDTGGGGINGLGQIVGTQIISGVATGFLYSGARVRHEHHLSH